MKRLACFLTVALVTSAFAADEKTKTDQEMIQGTWEVVSAESNGKAADFVGMKFVFTKDLWKMHKDGQDAIAVEYKLDPTKKPKAIDTSHELDPGKPIVQLGIYELKGDMLKLSLEAAARGRPEKFETKPGGTATSFVLKRAK
jgi:uncharacterized protein (TIGR03067 family)